MDTAIYALASSVREQAAAANGLRNLLSGQQNSSASFLFLLRRNIGTREFSEKFPLTPYYSLKIS